MSARIYSAAIVQPNYIPWCGYFDLIRRVDEFVLLDDVQYTKRDWRNRNRIKTPDGPKWLTIPVRVSGKYHQLINEVEVVDGSWRAKHWNSLLSNYRKTPFFDHYADVFESLYLGSDEPMLAPINASFITKICHILGIETRISLASDLQAPRGRCERLIEITRKLGAQHYLSGPAARSYIDEMMFSDAGIQVVWMQYPDYPPYPQPHPPFAPGLSVLDLLFNVGDQASDYIGVRDEQRP